MIEEAKRGRTKSESMVLQNPLKDADEILFKCLSSGWAEYRNQRYARCSKLGLGLRAPQSLARLHICIGLGFRGLGPRASAFKILGATRIRPESLAEIICAPRSSGMLSKCTAMRARTAESAECVGASPRSELGLEVVQGLQGFRGLHPAEELR